MSAACAPDIVAAAAKPAEVAIRKPFFPMGHSSCCSDRSRTSIGRCTLRTVLPPNPFCPYVSKTTQILTIFHRHDSSYYRRHSSALVDRSPGKVVPSYDAPGHTYESDLLLIFLGVF